MTVGMPQRHAHTWDDHVEWIYTTNISPIVMYMRGWEDVGWWVGDMGDGATMVPG